MQNIRENIEELKNKEKKKGEKESGKYNFCNMTDRPTDQIECSFLKRIYSKNTVVYLEN